MDDYSTQIHSDELAPLTEEELDRMYPCMGCPGDLMSGAEHRAYCEGCEHYKTANDKEDMF